MQVFIYEFALILYNALDYSILKQRNTSKSQDVTQIDYKPLNRLNFTAMIYFKVRLVTITS